MGRDDIALYLICSFIYLRNLRVAHIFLYRVISHITITAEYLYRVYCHFHRDIRGKHLRHRGLFCDRLSAGIDHPCRRINERPRRLEAPLVDLRSTAVALRALEPDERNPVGTGRGQDFAAPVPPLAAAPTLAS